ncbi:hypothetical protein J6590_007309 [Homalodisca vitripennis]|nr:hypothetical protein J6590_007303 [Homalodisca vitripennis]KAG8298724.1 hypothetical protein J6590_007309 [Homalodisca vitripennis]
MNRDYLPVIQLVHAPGVDKQPVNVLHGSTALGQTSTNIAPHTARKGNEHQTGRTQTGCPRKAAPPHRARDDVLVSKIARKGIPENRAFQRTI